MKRLNFENNHILIIGDCMLDKYINGTADRMSPEAPVKILDQQSVQSKLGGAANVAANVVSLGAQATLIGRLGDDHEGEELEKLCNENQIAFTAIKDSKTPTTVKTRVMAADKHLLRIDRESKEPLHEIDQLEDILQDILRKSKIDYIILQDYNKGMLSPLAISSCIKLAKEHHVSIAVDPKFDHIEAYRGVTLLKPNLREASHLLSISEQDFLYNLEENLRAIKTRLQIEQIWTTLGKHGIAYIDHQDTYGQSPVLIDSVVDVCGAGDAVIATMTLLQSHGLASSVIAELCNRAGGQVCLSPGVVTVSMQDLM